MVYKNNEAVWPHIKTSFEFVQFVLYLNWNTLHTKRIEICYFTKEKKQRKNDQPD